MVALFVVLTIVVFLLADLVVVSLRRHRAAVARGELQAHPLAELLPEPRLPGGVFLSPAHLWVGLMPAGQARIGFDPLVHSAMGVPDRIELPSPGTRVQKGQPLFTARWGTRTVSFPSPLEGTVQATATSPGELDAESWIVALEPAQAKRDLGLLPMAEEARRWFAQEWARLRDFVVAQSLQAAPAVSLPDGGTPVTGWLRHEPEATWSRFVRTFLQGEASS